MAMGGPMAHIYIYIYDPWPWVGPCFRYIYMYNPWLWVGPCFTYVYILIMIMAKSLRAYIDSIPFLFYLLV